MVDGQIDLWACYTGVCVRPEKDRPPVRRTTIGEKYYHFATSVTPTVNTRCFKNTTEQYYLLCINLIPFSWVDNLPQISLQEGIQTLSYSVSWGENLPPKAVRVRGDGHSSTTVRCSSTVIMPYQISVGHSRRAQVSVDDLRCR